MKDCRRGARTGFEIPWQLVWTTKYRRPTLTGEAALRVRDLIHEICAQHEVTMLKGHVAKDHLHLFRIDSPAGDDQPADSVLEGHDGL